MLKGIYGYNEAQQRTNKRKTSVNPSADSITKKQKKQQKQNIEKLEIHELINILESRAISYKLESKRRALQRRELECLVGLVSEEERISINEIRKASYPFLNQSMHVLKNTVLRAGLGKCSGLDKAGLIALIVQKNLSIWKPCRLDPDQSEFVSLCINIEKGRLLNTSAISINQNQIKEEKNIERGKTLLLVAGAGSGKTETLGQTGCAVQSENPRARMLIVMFNVAAEKSMRTRLAMLGATISPKLGTGSDSLWNLPCTITCMTFNKLASHVLVQMNAQHNVPLEDQLPEAVRQLLTTRFQLLIGL